MITLDSIQSLVGISWSLQDDGLVALVRLRSFNDVCIWFDDIDSHRDESHPDTRWRLWKLTYLIKPCYHELMVGDQVIALCDHSTIYYPAQIKAITDNHITVHFHEDEPGDNRILNKWYYTNSHEEIPTVIKKVGMEGTIQQNKLLKSNRMNKKRKRDIAEQSHMQPKKKLKKGTKNDTMECEKIMYNKAHKKKSLFINLQKPKHVMPLKQLNPHSDNKMNTVSTVNNMKKHSIEMNKVSKRVEYFKGKLSEVFEENKRLLKTNELLEKQNKNLSEQNKRYRAFIDKFKEI